MLDLWTRASLTLFDGTLGRLLVLPRSLTIVAVALFTALLFTLIRKWTTDQDRLRRAAADLRRLKELRRTSKLSGDRDHLAHLQRTKTRIGLIKLTAEGLPLLVAILPLVLLLTWAFARLELHPLREHETIEVTAYLPRSAEDDLIHLVPERNLRAHNGWVQPVRLTENPATAWDRFWAKITFSKPPEHEPDVVAVWQLAGTAAVEPYRLTFRWKDRTFEHELLIGQKIYSPALVIHEDALVTTKVAMRDVRLFGIPGLGAWLPAWSVGYIGLTILFVPSLKRLLRIY